jgi:uncharacterized protein (DUF885 family)
MRYSPSLPQCHLLLAAFLCFCPLLGFWGCTSGKQPESTNTWPSFRDQFLEGYFQKNPHFAVYQGRHDFDGQLSDWSPAGIAAKIDFLKSSRAAAQQFDATQLQEAERFERDYLVKVIDGDLYWLETASWPSKNPFYYANQMDPNVYLTREYAPLEQRLRAYIAYCGQVPRVVEQMQSNLQLPLPKTFIGIGHTMFGGLASYMEKEVPAVFEPVKDQDLQQQLQKATASAAGAMKEFDSWLGEQEASATDQYALGADSFSRMLAATEGVDLPLERLEAIGREDLERNTEALKQACAQFAPGKSLADCVHRMVAHKPAEGPVEAARKQLQELSQFVIDKDLVTVPGTEIAKVDEAPPHMRWNIAYIDIAGPYEKNQPSIYYIAPPDPRWSEAERRNYIPGVANLLFVSVHEVWPGHFLQFLHSNRTASKLGQVFVGYAFAEGWAHYAEEMMWDEGLRSGDPEIHIGQLVASLMRDARYLSAIGLHSGHMTVEESEKMFREQAFRDSGSAGQQAARGTFDPAYLNYTLGKLMIRKLRDDWTASRGGRQAWKTFHDQLLSYGGPPIPLLRRAMLGDNAGPPL